MGSCEVRVLPDAAALADAAAAVVADALGAAVAARGTATLALAGGHTPAATYRRLAARWRADVPWPMVHFYWGDERMVAPAHPDSNHGMARHELLAPLGIREEAIFPWHTGLGSPAAAAADYQDRLRRSFGLRPGERPSFDVVLLGLGGDGHTASLMPGCTAALEEREALTSTCCLPRLAHPRLTLTVPVLNAARKVVFLVSGAAKAEVLARVLDGPFQPELLPAQAVRPATAAPLWLVDRAAAGPTRV